MTLTDFLLARIAEDEADVVEDTRPYVGVVNDPEGRYWWECPWCFESGGHINAASEAPAAAVAHGLTDCPHRPRVLAECEAKRRIVERHLDEMVDGAGPLTAAYRYALTCLALPYADHLEYRKEWRP